MDTPTKEHLFYKAINSEKTPVLLYWIYHSGDDIPQGRTASRSPVVALEQWDYCSSGGRRMPPQRSTDNHASINASYRNIKTSVTFPQAPVHCLGNRHGWRQLV